MWKRGENFSSFPHYFIYVYISNFRSQITYSFVKCGCSIYCFPHSLNPDMSRYGYRSVLSESLGIRDNESRLYIVVRSNERTLFATHAAVFRHINVIKWVATSEDVPSDVYPAKIHTSLRIRTVWSESSLGTFWIATDAKCLHADNEDVRQTERMQSDLSLRWAHMSEGLFSSNDAQMNLYKHHNNTPI